MVCYPRFVEYISIGWVKLKSQLPKVTAWVHIIVGDKNQTKPWVTSMYLGLHPIKFIAVLAGKLKPTHLKAFRLRRADLA